MNKQTLVDTTYTPTYEEYLDWCELNEIEPCENESNDYWMFAMETRSIDLDDLLMNIRYCSINEQYYWVISGSLGLWNGIKDVYPTRTNSLLEAIHKCIDNCDDCIISKRGSTIYVTGLHHDGRNHFEIRALSDLGCDRWDRHDGEIALSNRENVQTLPKYLF